VPTRSGRSPEAAISGRTSSDERAASPPWPVGDGVVTLRPPTPGDEPILISGRDAEWERWLGPGSEHPRPTAVIEANGEIVGWVDYDPGTDWLGPGEVNVGYNVFAPHRRRGYAGRALRLLIEVLRDHTGYERAYFVIDVENRASLAVARALGARPVPERAEATGLATSVHHVVDVGGPGPGRVTGEQRAVD
jgi:RimJ/RimL family protein N-acetyltransferase